jgi:hypothetical protein
MPDPTPVGRSGGLVSCLVLSLAGLMLLLTLGLFTFLSMGFAAVVLAVFLGIFCVVGLQYLLCGWWLPQLIQRDSEEIDRE